MSSEIKILGANGLPIEASNGAHRGARVDRDMMSYRPALRSADADLLPDMERMTARAHELSYNDPLTSGAIQTQLDNIIGSGLRLSLKPDHRALGVSLEAATEWARDVESKFRAFAYDPGNYIDVTRKNNFAGLLGLAYRQFLVSGEILSVADWLPKKGNRKFSTAIKMVEPARLSNPHKLSDTDRLRGGVELSTKGEPIAYHIRNALQSDGRFAGAKTHTWERVRKETRWGRKQCIHVFDAQRAGQTRGKTGLASVIASSYKLGKFQDTSLEASIINAMYAAVIESEFNYAQVAEAMGGSDKSASDMATEYLTSQAGWHNASPVKMDGVKIPHLYPGEKFSFTTSQNPGPNYADFEKSFHRHQAAGWNMSYEMYARNYSDTNYAGARAGLQQAHRFFTGRREIIGSRFASEIALLFIEEGFDNGTIQPIPGAPDFYDARYAYTRGQWIGPAQGHIDPMKETNADVSEVKHFMGTLENKNASRGQDWEETIDQRLREIAYQKRAMEAHGLTLDDLNMVNGTAKPAKESAD